MNSLCSTIRCKYYGIVAASLVLLSACSDNVVNDVGIHSQKPFNLQANIEQKNTTRVNDNGFADGDQIGVFIVNYDKDFNATKLKLTGNHADNVRFTYDDENYKWTGSYQIYWKDVETPVDVYGYYPFDQELSSIQAQPFTVERNQRDVPSDGSIGGYEKSDFLWAKAERVVPTEATIILEHSHIMAGIEVTLVEGNGFAENEWSATERSVLIPNMVMTGTINLSNGVATPVGSASNVGIIPQESQGKYRAVVFPQTVSADKALLAITIDGKTLLFKREESMEYYRGKMHKFSIEVSKASEEGDFELNLLSEAVVNWESDPLSHNGTAREYITVHVNEGEYLGDVISSMGIEDPSLILNLKLTGCIDRGDNFSYIREKMPNLEAINMKELRTINMQSYYWESGWVEPAEHNPTHADDYLPMWSFENMAFLQYVVWPDSLKGLGNGVFAGCPLRGSLIFPEGLRHIGDDVFGAYGHRMNNLTGEVYIPSSVIHIGNGIMGDYDGKLSHLSGELVLPHSMKHLGTSFNNCPRLTGQIRIPEGLTEVYRFAGSNMTGDVVIPQGVKKVHGIGGQPSSIYFPEGIEEIGSEAFRGVSSLKGDLKLPSTIKTISNSAFAGTSYSHVSLPENLEIIENDLFNNCKYLQDTLIIPSSVVQIKERAFEGCEKLNAIILPENLTQIWYNSLNGCWSLDYLQCNAKVPPTIEGGNLQGLEKNNFSLVVPEGSVDAYRNAPGWNEFKRISAYRNFVCRPMNAKLLNKAATRTVILNSDGDWAMTHCPSWIHVDKESGSKKTALTVNIDAMAHGSANREDSVVFTLQGKVDEEGNPITCYYKVQQFDYEHDEDGQHQLQAHTQGKGVNIVFIGDGYDAEDIATESYLDDVKEGMEYFFDIEPYKTYKEYFDVYVDFPMSYESGVCSNVNIWRTTKFSTTYGARGNGRLKVNAEDMMSYVLNDVTETVVNADNVNQTLIITILNSDVYEGVATLWSTGAAVAVVPHSRYSYPNDFRGVMQHEAGGHGFGKLGDEYIYHRAHIRRCPCMCCSHAEVVEFSKSLGWYRNLSLSGKYSDNEWRHLIFDDRYQDIVDIYEGGHMHSEGIYRSEVNSCMNNNVPYYSTISRQAIVERILDYAGEEFDFETFVSKDSREIGNKFITRSGSMGSLPNYIKGNAPVVIKGSPLKNMRRKVKYNTTKHEAR